MQVSFTSMFAMSTLRPYGRSFISFILQCPIVYIYISAAIRLGRNQNSSHLGHKLTVKCRLSRHSRDAVAGTKWVEMREVTSPDRQKSTGRRNVEHGLPIRRLDPVPPQDLKNLVLSIRGELQTCCDGGPVRLLRALV